MAQRSSTFVSVVAPLRGDGRILEAFARDVLAVLAGEYLHYELVLVDDSPSGDAAAAARRLVQSHAGVRLLRLSRPHGWDVAVVAGLEATIGEAVVVLRPDCDPPGVIPRVVWQLGRGSDVVLGVAANAPPRRRAWRLLRWAFLLACRRAFGVKLAGLSASLCGFTRRAVNALTRVKQKHRHLPLLCCRIGYAQATFAYRQEFRARPPRRHSLPEAVGRGVSLLLAHSVSPLRLISGLGVFAGFLNLLYVAYVCAVNVIKQNVAEGWTTLSLQTALMFFFVFLILVLMSEYLSHILQEARDNPLYHVLEEVSGPAATDPALRNVLDHSPPGEEQGSPDPGEDRYAA